MSLLFVVCTLLVDGNSGHFHIFHLFDLPCWAWIGNISSLQLILPSTNIEKRGEIYNGGGGAKEGGIQRREEAPEPAALFTLVIYEKKIAKNQNGSMVIPLGLGIARDSFLLRFGWL